MTNDEISAEIARALREFKTKLESEQARAESSKRLTESEKRLERTKEWSNRALSVIAGFCLGLVFIGAVSAVSQCTELNKRVTNLELKK